MSEKDAGMRIRVERTLREEFLKACRAQDLPAAQVIRAFMREYVKKQQNGQAQRDEESETQR
ncbi:hypothetical protein [Roseitalea porphyridii]|uniref:Ribbon-helix-helix protein RHH domain-containing protein n=1 Tax=Roseitalea porphyridii TaxID=1852022 RepID=A0A4P6UZM3_9HYPH|nr:hypothetical protein [Roseitalea porphyridii]QBK29784.1 hypothetical protein E0E05_03715 [Roseitalea porphyridii]